jgi:nitroimidazol reductase NimA-like FMN-containing flavoprotein (pyridoxamine 5'-phosphate oxidase superfamily)
MQHYGRLTMDAEELEVFLAGPGRIGTMALASLRRDGSPLVTPVGYLYESGRFFVSIGGARSGITRLRHDPRVSCTVFNDAMPVRFVIVQGLAEDVPDPDHAISRRLIAAAPLEVYGIDRATFVQEWLGLGRTVFRIVPTEMTSMDQGKAARDRWHDPRMKGDRPRGAPRRASDVADD